MPKLNPKKILVVEDEEFLRDMYQVKLQEEGYDVFGAHNGKMGISLAELEQPNLILLDIIMPDVDGYEMLERLKKNSRTKSIPVIIFSNLSQKEEIEKGFKLGAADFVIKTSVTPGEIADKVKQQLNKKR